MFEMINLHTMDRESMTAALRQRMALSAQKGGVYVLVTSPPDDEHWNGIGRLLGWDRNGWLYVGQSKHLESRLLALFLDLTDPSHRAHGLGPLWHRHPSLKATFALSRMKILVIPSARPRQAETDLLAGYVVAFGEGPPWNTRIR